MRFTINTKEFKNVMSLVKTVADCTASALVTAHNVCLLRAFPETKELRLEFSLKGSFKGSFFAYVFESAQLESVDQATTEVRRSIDLETLSALKLSGTTVSIVLGKNKDGNTLEFSSGRTKGKLILSHPDIEKEVDANRPETNSIDPTQTFRISDFITALSAHVYGSHFNKIATKRRVLRIYNKKQGEGDEGTIYFASRDNNVGALFSKPMSTPYKEAFDYYVLPTPFKAVLEKLPQDVCASFNFGIDDAKQMWRINHGNTNVWFSNIASSNHKLDMEILLNKTAAAPACILNMLPDKLEDALEEIAPFTSGSLFITKEESSTPLIKLLINDNGTAAFSIDTMRAKDVVVELEDVEFIANTEKDSSDLKFNANYLKECVSALTANVPKKDMPPISLMWWPQNDPQAPINGKAVCLKQGDNYYWLAKMLTNTKVL